MLAQKVTDHLEKIIKKSPAVRKEFLADDDEEKPPAKGFFSDPLEEERFTKVRGLIHKYEKRVLVILTLQCAAYCRFCTRQRCVSDIKKGIISDTDLEKMRNYLLTRPVINEVILSGGDPLTVPLTLTKALKIFSSLKQIKVLRIGTRVPVSDPKIIPTSLLKGFKKIKQPLYILIHFEHPDELTKETIEAITKLRQSGGILLSQTVFLKGVNDSMTILYKLFSKLIEIGVKPYYLFRCDPVVGAEKFRVPFKKEVEIATELRKKLSGLAYPLYVIDTSCGSGKIPVPLNFWEFNKTHYSDFLGVKSEII